MLSLVHVSKRFGGLNAVADVSIEFQPGRVTGLIGPNGAGKTTLFHLITGVLRPSSGRILYLGEDLTGLAPFRIARRGIGRTFQQLRIFSQLTVLENVLLGLPEVSDSLWQAVTLGRRRQEEWRRRAMESLTFVGMAERAGLPAASLGYGEQKLVMFACLLCTGAQTLLLDEPAAGLDPGSRQQILETVRRLREAGKTIVLIEHNLDVVRSCCDQVVFLAEGQVVTVGSVQDVEADPRLADLYFGTAGGGGRSA